MYPKNKLDSNYKLIKAVKTINGNTPSPTPTPTPTPQVFTGFDVFITNDGHDLVINYTAQELAENIVKCAKHHGNVILITGTGGSSTFCEIHVNDQMEQVGIAFSGINGEIINCNYNWGTQITSALVQVSGTPILSEEVKITEEMQEYFNYILTNLGINRK